MTAQAFEISSLEDLERVTASVGLVGPRTGAAKRTKEQMEWYVLRRFLEKAIPAGIFGLPLAIRRGCPPKEPDFVLMHGGVAESLLAKYMRIALASFCKLDDSFGDDVAGINTAPVSLNSRASHFECNAHDPRGFRVKLLVAKNKKWCDWHDAYPLARVVCSR
jgi:hypothetical protein